MVLTLIQIFQFSSSASQFADNAARYEAALEGCSDDVKGIMLAALEAEHAQLAATPPAALASQLATAKERVAAKASCFDSDYLGWHALHWLPMQRNDQQITRARNELLAPLTNGAGAASWRRALQPPMQGAENPSSSAPLAATSSSGDERHRGSTTGKESLGGEPKQQQDRQLSMAPRPPQLQQVRE
jgi:hypothetical protein